MSLLIDLLSGDDALAISLISVGTSANEPASTLASGYVVDQSDTGGGGFRTMVGVRRVPSPGATAMTWSIPVSHYWGSLVFNIAGA